MNLGRPFVTIDLDKKWTFLCEMAGGASLSTTAVLRHFADPVKAETWIPSIRQSLKPDKWLKSEGSIEAEFMHRWVAEVMQSLDWCNGKPEIQDFIDFYGMPFDDWKEKLPSEHHELSGEVLPAEELLTPGPPHADDHITVVVDPNDHSLDDYSTFDRDGMIDQKFMYLSPQSVHHWHDVTSSGTYETYVRCKETLSKTLMHPAIAKLRYPVILGAGAAQKEELIFSKSLENHSGGIGIAAYIDASFYMLMSSFRGVRNYIPKIAFDLYCMDMLNEPAWENIVKLRDEPATFFLLGETVGNLHEADMLNIFRFHMRSGDKLVVGGEFYEDAGEIESETGELIERYQDAAVIDLVMGHLTALSSPTFEDVTPKDKRDFVDVRFVKSKNFKLAKLRSLKPGTRSICFMTNKPIEVGRTYLRKGILLGTSKRYVTSELKWMLEHEDHGDLTFVDEVKHPGGKRYKHLIFSKS